MMDLPEPPEPGAGEIVCRTLEVGICGTDREILLSTQPHVPPGDGYLVLGHECLARVEAVGPHVTSLSPGDLVTPVVRRAHDPHATRPDLLPWGDFVERGIYKSHGFTPAFFVDRPEHVFRVPHALAAVAVLAEPVSVAEKGVNEALAVQRGRLGPNAWSAPPPRVLITGMGPIGFAAVLACTARGWPTTMVGRDAPDAFRAALAAELGASYHSLAAGPPQFRDVEREGFDLALECTGSDEIMLAAATWLAACGVMVWLGSSRVPQAAHRNVARLMRDSLLHNHVHLGSVNAAPRDFVDALAHLEAAWQAHPSAVAQIVTERIPLNDSAWHYIHRRPQGIKTVIAYGD